MLSADTADVVGARLALRRLDTDTRRDIARTTRQTLTPLWARLVRNRIVSRQDRAVYGRPAARVTAAGAGTLTAATTKRPLSGGLVPADDWPLVEFGSGRAHGRRGQLPPRHPQGRVAFDSAARFAPTAASVWLRVIADGIRDATRGETAG